MKYKLTDETKEWKGRVLHRIMAVTKFRGIDIGTLGGWVESEKNLSQLGDAWVYDDAQVCDNANVYDKAAVYGNAKVYENAQVSGNAHVCDHAWVYDHAVVCDNADVSGYAEVYGYAKVSSDVWGLRRHTQTAS